MENKGEWTLLQQERNIPFAGLNMLRGHVFVINSQD